MKAAYRKTLDENFTSAEGYKANKAYALIAVGNAANVACDKKAAAALAAEAEKTTGKIADPEQQKDALQDVRALQAAIKK